MVPARPCSPNLRLHPRFEPFVFWLEGKLPQPEKRRVFLAFPMFLTLFVSNEFSHNNHTHIRVELCSRVTFRSTLHRTLRTTNPGGALGVCVFTSLVAFRGLRAPGGDLVVYTHRQYTTAATGGVSCRTCSKKLSVFAQVPPKVDIQNSTIFKNSRREHGWR